MTGMTPRERIVALHRAGDLAAAVPLYGDWLARNPGDAGMWSNLGAALRKAGRLEQALRAHRRAQALAGPRDAQVLANLANVLADLGKNREAIALRRRLLELQGPDPMTEAMIGKALRADGRAPAAVDWLRGALTRHPGHVEIRLQLALALLAAGRWAEGFDAFGMRWESGELTPRRMSMPKWDGAPLDGRSLLVMPEQGFGDSIAFARFLLVARDLGASRVILAARPPLLRLLQAAQGADLVCPEAEARGDLWCDLMDLPAHGFTRDAAVPPPTRLAVPEDSRARARAVTAPYRDRLRVGVVWSGSPSFRANAARSFSHERFLPLADIPGVQLFSLYKGPALAPYRADGSAAFIIDACGPDRDFADCAAMMEEMDLIVTSDTVTAHLAGSLGRPVWTLLHWDAFWLWGRGSDRTPWYPSMRLIRQTRPHDWSDVFETVARDLAALAGEKRR
ncbi:tetratricopeptide repeat protein [Limimaricola variabilis]|nr:tetratricopeptide repeat-containing glycosyltransferase family protein [Limimaricola variabilis]